MMNRQPACCSTRVRCMPACLHPHTQLESPHLLSCSWLDEIGLWNDLDSVCLVRVQSGTHVDLGKATFAEHSAPQIAMRRVSFSVEATTFLLDNNVTAVVHLTCLVGVVKGRFASFGRKRRWVPPGTAMRTRPLVSPHRLSATSSRVGNDTRVVLQLLRCAGIRAIGRHATRVRIDAAFVVGIG